MSMYDSMPFLENSELISLILYFPQPSVLKKQNIHPTTPPPDPSPVTKTKPKKASI